MVPVRVKGDLEDKMVMKVCAGGSHVLAITSNGNLYDANESIEFLSHLTYRMNIGFHGAKTYLVSLGMGQRRSFPCLN